VIRRPWRITEPMGKVAYVVGATVVGVFLVLLLVSSPLPDELVAAAYFVAWVAVGVRVFRGAGEQVEAPRAWWRMTSRPTAGFVLAAVLGLGVLVPAGAPSSAPQVVAQLVVGVAYLGSSIALVSRRPRRGGAALVSEQRPTSTASGPRLGSPSRRPRSRRRSH
jgi:hypothetical protein